MRDVKMVLMLSLVSFLAAACDDPPAAHDSPTPPDPLGPDRPALVARAQELVQRHQLAPIELPKPSAQAKVELGRQLFFDPILSGNKDISCATCHHPDHATADGVPVSAGTMAVERGGFRVPGPGKAFTSRHSPDLFNRGQRSFINYFWDARLQRLEDGRVVLFDRSEEQRPDFYLRVMPSDLDDLLAAQAMMPVLSRDEMRGSSGDRDASGQPNRIALIGNHDLENAWRLIFEQVWSVEAYRPLLAQAYPELPQGSLSMVHLANALGAFMQEAFTFDDSPYDRFLRGQLDAMSDEALRGMDVFFGDRAKCGDCHTGQLLSDQKVYNIAVRPITRGPDPQRGVDLGAMHRAWAGPEARYAFRTTPLRNVELTAPYLHNGMYTTLEQVIDFKDDSLAQFWAFDPASMPGEFGAQLHRDAAVLKSLYETLAPQAQQPLGLTAQEKRELVAFLKSLTSPSARDLSGLEPASTVSGLPLVSPPRPLGVASTPAP